MYTEMSTNMSINMWIRKSYMYVHPAAVFLTYILQKRENKHPAAGRIHADPCRWIKGGKAMKILVIPDVHLKPWMFTRADEIMTEEKPDKAVCLMDIADDWGQEQNLQLYRDTYDAAIRFARKYPRTLWCCGNHDMSYLWGIHESGYSKAAEPIVREKMHEHCQVLPDISQIAYVHRIDNILFSHGGLTKSFVRERVPGNCRAIDVILQNVNMLEDDAMWREYSPIWARPQIWPRSLYDDDEYLQVVGHTPVKKIEQYGNLISCDVFSTFRNGQPIGSCEYLLLNALTWEWRGIR